MLLPTEILDDPRAWVRLPAKLLLAAGLAALTVALSHLLSGLMGQVYFFWIFPAVAAAALLGGGGCGALCAGLALGAYSVAWLEPVGSLWISSAGGRWRVAGVLCSSLLVAALAGAFRREYGRARDARRRAELAEQHARRLAETHERVSAVLGHDLRTPLSAIRLAAEMIRRADPDHPQVRSVDRILASADRMGHMIQDLLDVARARHGIGIALTREPARLDELCQRVVEEARHAYPDREIRLETAQVTVVGDPSRLQQVAANLVVNALQHGAPSEAVRVELREDLAGALLRVHNGGDPIPPDLVPHLFDPFRRAVDEAGGAGGLGLGLFIVQEIVRGHGGRVRVESAAGAGTTFEVVLPVRPAGPAPRTFGPAAA